MLKPNGKGGFIWETITAVSDVTEYSRDLFKIKQFDDYIYSSSNGSGIDVAEFEDGTMYIKLVYGVIINVVNRNFYDSGRDSEIGGYSLINGKIMSSAYRIGDTITVQGNATNGYLFKHWVINGETLSGTNQSIIVDENTTCEAVFIGKLVKINFGTNPRGVAAEPTGGNMEMLDSVKYYHVGDIINLSANPLQPYVFYNVWVHNITGQFVGDTYVITLEDGVNEEFELTPIFSGAFINVSFEIEDSQGTVTSDDVVFSIDTPEGKVIYSCELDYNLEVTININTNDKFKYDSIWLLQGEVEVNVSHLVNADGVLTFILEQFDVMDEFVFIIKFEKAYWYNYVIEKGLIVIDGEVALVTQDFIGSGKQDDPYLIRTADDYALWAYIINYNVTQSNSNKMPYNTDLTYYRIVNVVLLNEYFWTPIGTSINPFNGKVTICSITLK